MNKTFASLVFIVALAAVSGFQPANAANMGNTDKTEKYDVKCFYYNKVMIDSGPYSITEIPHGRAIKFITMKDADGRKILMDDKCILTQILPEDEERERAALEEKEAQKPTEFPKDGPPRHAIGG
jgi:hypothetical protein